MNVNELFFNSALINASLFLWLASATTATILMIRCGLKMSTSAVFAIIFGPLALMGAWIYQGKVKDEKAKIKKPKNFAKSLRSVLGVIFVALAINALFYVIFIANYTSSIISSEALLSKIAIFVMAIGFVGGIVLSAITLRVALLESLWATVFFAFFALMLSTWADEAFPYATSSAYFVTLLLTVTLLLLIFLTFGGSLGYLFFGEGRFNARYGYESFIGTRFLMTKRSSHVVSLIAIISVFAVMIACGGMIVVMSVMNGFTSDLRAKILGANAHLMVLKYGKDFTEYKEIIDKTKDIKGIAGASAFILNEGMVSSNRNLSGSIITGIDLENVANSDRMKYVGEKALTNLKDPKKIPVVNEIPSTLDEALKKPDAGLSPKNELPGVILGKEMASDLQVFVGDIVNLISPIGEIGPTGPIPRAKPFRVAGLFFSGMYEYDSRFAYIALKDAQDFFNLKSSVTGIEYRLNDVDKTKGIAKEIEAKIGGYPFYARDWMQMNRNMFSALQLEKIAMLIILGTLIFMASLLILVTLIMVVMEKGKEIAILKSMGATDVSIMKIFVNYGLFVGSLGAFLGGAFGFLVCVFIEKIGIRIDPDVYYFSSLPVKIVVSEALLVILAAVLISFLATIPPALFAARQKPVEGLRYE